MSSSEENIPHHDRASDMAEILRRHRVCEDARNAAFAVAAELLGTAHSKPIPSAPSTEEPTPIAASISPPEAAEIDAAAAAAKAKAPGLTVSERIALSAKRRLEREAEKEEWNKKWDADHKKRFPDTFPDHALYTELVARDPRGGAFTRAHKAARRGWLRLDQFFTSLGLGIYHQDSGLVNLLIDVWLHVNPTMSDTDSIIQRITHDAIMGRFSKQSKLQDSKRYLRWTLKRYQYPKYMIDALAGDRYEHDAVDLSGSKFETDDSEYEKQYGLKRARNDYDKGFPAEVEAKAEERLEYLGIKPFTIKMSDIEWTPAGKDDLLKHGLDVDDPKNKDLVFVRMGEEIGHGSSSSIRACAITVPSPQEKAADPPAAAEAPVAAAEPAPPAEPQKLSPPSF